MHPVAIGQPPNRMKMIGHHYPGDDLERVMCAHIADHFTQIIHALDQQTAGSIGQVYGEKIAGSADQGATITDGRGN